MNGTEMTLTTMRLSVERHNLLEHPFYKAWSAGTLPQRALATYAREYGAFIRVLDHGWQTLGEDEGAAIERQHVALWDDFTRALDTVSADAPSLEGVETLVTEAIRSFEAPSTAAGALYAFEAQQPATAASKLEGLDTHYPSLPPAVRPYFRAHALETGEQALLEEKVAAMSAEEQGRAAAACERMARALWEALTSIHAVTCADAST